MWKRALPWLALAGVAVVCVVVVRQMPASPAEPENKPQPPAVGGGAPPAPAAPAAAVKIAASRVAAVTVYPNSALITREVDVPEGMGNMELTVNPLPPTTINSSLYSEGTDGIRVLTTRYRTRPILQDTREDVRKLQDEIKQLAAAREKLEGDIAAAQENMKMLAKMEGFMGVTSVSSTEKGGFKSEEAIAMSKHIKDQRLETSRELVTLRQQVQTNQEKADFAQRKLSDLASGITRTERDAVLIVEKTNAAAGKVRLNYLVDAAAWRPQYKFRAGKNAKDAVQLEYLAAIVQQTGEDWANVNVVLSTAQPMLNAAPPELQTLQVTVVPKGAGQPMPANPAAMDIEEQVKSLRGKGQKDFNERKQSSGTGLFNTAAALDQSWELLNPDEAMRRGCALAVSEGPTVTYHLNSKLSVPSRNDEQVLEVARIELPPDYYYKAVPLLTTHVYRLADLTNKSNLVLLPGDATMYIGADFVGQMSLPLVAIGEQFTVGFGVDPQLQVQRQMIDKARTTQGGNQSLRYEYRIRVSSYKTERIRLQVWDRVPHGEGETVNIALIKTTPELSKDPNYVREQRNNNLLRWDVTIDPTMTGEKALAINYEFKLELDRQMTINSFQSSGSFGATSLPTHANPVAPNAAPHAPMSSAEQARIKAALAKLSAEDRHLAEA
jgi:uncharacterized protein (TIGR02231 family)